MMSPVPPDEQAWYKREMDMVRSQLGEESFQRAYAEGRDIPTEQAVDEALE